jgi:transposase, IS6 family
MAVFRWRHFAGEIILWAARLYCCLSFSRRVDETYVRVKGHWKYLYRAIDKEGATLDFYLADRCNAKVAKHFLTVALKRSQTGSRR